MPQERALQCLRGAKHGGCAQVGKDTRAQAFLAELDNDPMIGNIIDATSSYELEYEEFKRKGVNLTPDIWLVRSCCAAALLVQASPCQPWCAAQVKLLCGAIDRALDEQVWPLRVLKPAVRGCAPPDVCNRRIERVAELAACSRARGEQPAASATGARQTEGQASLALPFWPCQIDCTLGH